VRDFKEFLKLLNSNNIEYLLIGGYAVGIYGYVRATNGLDIWINANSLNAAKMVEIDELTVPVISLARLRENKKASGRAKDLADLESLPQ
jgi:predicted nucleotidyltransferase